MKKILFITHDSSRTGAPLVLLYFLQWLKKNEAKTDITLLALDGGPLEEDFKKTVDTFYKLSDFKLKELTFFQDIKKRVYRKMNVFKEKTHPKNVFFQEIAKGGFDLIYANTVVSVPVACKIKTFNPKLKIVAHIHELQATIQLFVSNLSDYVDQIDSFIVASNLVKQNLENTYKISDQKIKTIYEFTCVNREFKKQEDDHFLVGGAGVAGWRKGSDLFVQVAKYIKDEYTDLKIKFIWIGRLSYWEKIILENDLIKTGLSETVNFTGLLDSPDEIFSNLDVFLMTSREDPFPLVCIEVGMLGKPIIGFKGATGTEEVLVNKKENFVPYLDIASMGEKIIEYYRNRDLLQRDSEDFKTIFSKYTPEKISPIIIDHIKNVLDNSN